MGYDFLMSSIINLWPTLTIVCVALICVRIVYARYHKNKVYFHTEFWLLLSVVYLLLLYELLTRSDMNFVSGSNLIPFKGMIRYLHTPKQFFYIIIGNVLVFVPFGFIVSFYSRTKKIWSSLFIGIVVSTTVELVQREIGRSFDIDDIILNTVGCIIGYLIYTLYKKAKRRLPEFTQTHWFKNIICIIITICIGIYLVKAGRI